MYVIAAVLPVIIRILLPADKQPSAGKSRIQAAAAVEQMQADKLVANSPDGTLGSFDIDRVTKFIEVAGPVLASTGAKVKDGLVPDDIVTNKYIDSSINLP